MLLPKLIQGINLLKSTTKKTSSTSYSMLTLLLKIFSVFQLIPFHIEWNRNQGCFVLRKKFLQTITCFVLHMASFLVLLPRFVRLISEFHRKKDDEIDPVVVFKLADYSFYSAMVLYTTFLFWRRQTLLLKFINETHVFALSLNRRKQFIMLALYVGNFLLRTFAGRSATVFEELTEARKHTNVLYGIFSSGENKYLQLPISSVLLIGRLLISLFQYLQYGLILTTIVTIRVVWRSYKDEINILTARSLEWVINIW